MGQGMSQVLHLDSGRKLVRGGHGSFDGGEQKVVNPHTWGEAGLEILFPDQV